MTRRARPRRTGAAWRSLVLLEVLVALLAARPARAQDLSVAAPPAVSASLRLGAWSSPRTLDDRFGAATLSWWAKGGAPLAPNVAVFAEGWAGYRDLGRTASTTGVLREAYLDASLGPLELRAGRQIVAWGRADGLNPTDNVGPRDYTLLVPDDDDQRFGIGALKAALYAGSVSFTGLWLPAFDAHVVPLPAFPPGVTAREERPDLARALAQAAARIEQTGLAVDWSLSYFDGFDRAPNLAIASASASEVVIALRHPRIRVLGADAATVVGRFGLRGEAAYTATADSQGDDPQIKNPFFKVVVGGDRTFLSYLDVNVQYVLQVITLFHDPRAVADPGLQGLAIQSALASNQWDRVQHGGTLRVSNKWLNETLEAEILGAAFGPTRSYLVRGKVSYALSDRWRAILGFDWFDGVRSSPLRFLRPTSSAFAEVRLAL